MKKSLEVRTLEEDIKRFEEEHFNTPEDLHAYLKYKTRTQNSSDPQKGKASKKGTRRVVPNAVPFDDSPDKVALDYKDAIKQGFRPRGTIGR